MVRKVKDVGLVESLEQREFNEAKGEFRILKIDFTKASDKPPQGKVIAIEDEMTGGALFQPWSQEREIELRGEGTPYKVFSARGFKLTQIKEFEGGEAHGQS
jgi:hypothetical protein